MPKIVSKCPIADHASSDIVSKCPKLFQNAQWAITWSDTPRTTCLLECFKMPKIVSKCPIADHALPEIVSKCPILFQNAQNLSYGYWIIITTQLLSVLRALLTIWIVLLNVLPHQSWFVIRGVNLTYNITTLDSSWSGLMLSWHCTTGLDGAWGLITIPYFGSQC